MLFITETKTRTTTAPYREAGVKGVNTRLEQCVKQRMTHKPPTKLLSPKACVKIGQWNVRKMFKTGKCSQVIKEMQRYGINILGVSEMRWNSCGKMRVATRKTVLYSGMDEGGDHVKGVGFIFYKEAAQCLLEWEPVSDRIIRARFNWRWQQVTILQCYAPTNEATEKAKDDFYDQLEMVLEQVPCRDVKIVMGNMNAKVGLDNTGREEVMGKHGVRAEMNENGERLAHFCQADELVIGGTLFPHKEYHKRIWRSPDGGIEMEELPAGRSRDARGRRWVGPPPVDCNRQAKDCQSEKREKVAECVLRSAS